MSLRADWFQTPKGASIIAGDVAGNVRRSPTSMARPRPRHGELPRRQRSASLAKGCKRTCIHRIVDLHKPELPSSPAVIARRHGRDGHSSERGRPNSPYRAAQQIQQTWPGIVAANVSRSLGRITKYWVVFAKP